MIPEEEAQKAAEMWSEYALQVTNDNFPYEDDREGDPISQEVQSVCMIVLEDFKASLKAEIEQHKTMLRNGIKVNGDKTEVGIIVDADVEVNRILEHAIAEMDVVLGLIDECRPKD